jgi:hypothetical protein
MGRRRRRSPRALQAGATRRDSTEVRSSRSSTREWAIAPRLTEVSPARGRPREVRGRGTVLPTLAPFLPVRRPLLVAEAASSGSPAQGVVHRFLPSSRSRRNRVTQVSRPSLRGQAARRCSGRERAWLQCFLARRIPGPEPSGLQPCQSSTDDSYGSAVQPADALPVHRRSVVGDRLGGSVGCPVSTNRAGGRG